MQLRRALAWAGGGALTGAIVLLALYLARPAVSFDMDRALPRSIAGIYDVERSSSETFAWTSGRAILRLPGLDRGGEWECVARVRGARPPDQPLPQLTASVDGLVVGSMTAANEYRDFEVVVPARRSAGATLVLTSEPTFVPGNGDPRALGVQLDRLACAPRRSWVMPPATALRGAVGAIAVLALAVAIAGCSIGEGVLIVAFTAVAVGWLLVSGGAVFGPFSSFVWRWTVAISASVVLVTRGLEAWRRQPLSGDARRAIWVLGVGALLRMLALAHPGKPLVDALFQAHRLEWVLEGRYFFTQPMPSGVEFPYAIGLYVFAAPWTYLTTDFVTLLRAVVVLIEAVAGGLLYAAIVGNALSSRQALLAVVLYQSVLLPFVVVGNGNLTNAFAQSAALVTLTLVALAPPRPGRIAAVAGVALMATLALSSHVSTALMLGATLACLVGLFATLGGAPLRPAAIGLTVALLLAASASFFLYYRHFDEVFATAWNRVGEDSVVTPAQAETSAASEVVPAGRDAAPVSLATRTGVAAREAVRSFGWPVLLLAGVGLLTFRRADLATPLGCLLLAWGCVWFGVTGTMVGARVGAEFERYAIEFLGRVNLAVYPLLAVLGARGASGRWSSLPAAKIVAGTLVVLAAIGGGRAWLNWFS